MSAMTARTAARRPGASPLVGHRPADRTSPCAPGSTERLRRLRGGAPTIGHGEAGPSVAQAQSGPPTGIPGVLLTGPPTGAPLGPLSGTRSEQAVLRPGRPPAHSSARPSARAAGLAGCGLGVLGAVALSSAPAQAAPVEFPEWAVVTGSTPDAAGLDAAAAAANLWTFSWSTAPDGTVTFAYADGTVSSTQDPVARPVGQASTGTAAQTPTPPSPSPAPLAVQSLADPLWGPAGTGPAAPAAPAPDPAAPDLDPGLDDLARVASTVFADQGAPSAADPSLDRAGSQQGGGQSPADPSSSSAGTGAGVADADLVATARQGLGGSYVWGGNDFGAWDCSSFVQWVYAQHGLQLPRVTWEQFATATPTAAPRPGDLVSQNGGSHVGIYLGGDRMISALNPQEGTIEHSVHDMALDGYYTVR